MDHVHRGANAAGMVRYPSAIAVVVGVALGVALSQAGPAEATRNSAGTYSLPGGNPVVSGTTISSAWANNTLADVATELTNSLDRQGRGGMLAPLKLANGSSSAPAVSWTSDPDTGLYRAGAGDMRATVDGSPVQRWTSGETRVMGNLVAEVTSSFLDTASFADVVASQGVSATGAAPSGTAIVGTGVGSGAGGTFFGGPSSDGITAFGGSSGGTSGITASGGPGGPGGYFIAGTAATATTSRPAITAVNGAITFESSTADLNPNVAVVDTITQTSIVKAWGTLNTVGGGSTAVNVAAGFNVSSAVANSDGVTVTLAAPFANSNFAVITNGFANISCFGYALTASTIRIECFTGDASTGVVFNMQAGVSKRLMFVALGAQ